MERDKGQVYRWGELALLYGLPPLFLGVTDAPRAVYVGCLWFFAAVCSFYLARQPGFSWSHLWRGEGWEAADKKKAMLRFFALAPVLAGFAYLIAPDRFLSFPLERPRLWAVVMLLYPLLSVVPQSIVFRVFFFARYGEAFPNRWALFIVNGLGFGFAHAMYGNWVSPLLSACGGVLFAFSYAQHRSLKWAAIEHAAYGNLIFTLGIGLFFFKHG